LWNPRELVSTHVEIVDRRIESDAMMPYWQFIVAAKQERCQVAADSFRVNVI